MASGAVRIFSNLPPMWEKLSECERNAETPMVSDRRFA
jgi:hypothetical protein